VTTPDPPDESSPDRAEARGWSAAFAPLRRRISPGLLLAIVSAAAYVLALGLLALAKYATFHATFEDLGIENQVLWLLSHGGIPEYYSSGFASIYPLQYQKPILFLVLPFYALYPHPETLLVIGTFALGGAAVPLFLTARRWLQRESYALVVVFAYLVYFPVASANLFDFHYEDLFPLAFFTMTWCYASGRTRAMYAAALLTASVNPLALVTAIAFLVFTCLPGPREPLGLGWIRSSWRAFFRDPRMPVIVFVLIALLALYAVAGVLFVAGVGAHGSTATPTGILLGNANNKLILVILLAGSLAFLPLYSPRGLVTALPYFAFMAYSLDSANYQAFGLMYPLLGTGPLFLAALDGLRAADPQPPALPVEGDAAAASTHSPAPPPARTLPSRRRVSERGAMVRSLLVASVLFALVLFPLSPINYYVSGGYFSGNHDLANITESTAETTFLARVIALVPANASVLTQNNIPQLSGREHVQTPTVYQPSIPYDAIVMDSSLTYFSTTTDILPFVNAAFSNSSFGVVAEGFGALYLQRGYAGPPRLFAPLNEDLPGDALIPFDSIANGTELTGSGPGYSLWYGPYLTLFPGTYTCRFTMASNTTDPALGAALTIDATANDGATTLASETVFPANFTSANGPTSFQLSFNLTAVTTNVELRGMFPSGVAAISLIRIALLQTGYVP